jgi:hypothetical protein
VPVGLRLTIVVFADTLSLGEHFILKPVAAMAAAQANFLNIPLVNRKDLAGTGTTHPIDKTFSLLCQCGTGKKQIAAGSALPAVSPAEKKLGFKLLSCSVVGLSLGVDRPGRPMAVIESIFYPPAETLYFTTPAAPRPATFVDSPGGFEVSYPPGELA